MMIVCCVRNYRTAFPALSRSQSCGDSIYFPHFVGNRVPINELEKCERWKREKICFVALILIGCSYMISGSQHSNPKLLTQLKGKLF